jgi:hypothetical protein
MYNLPSVVSSFTMPTPGVGLHGSRSLRGPVTDPDQVRLLAQLDTQVWAELTAAQDMLLQVSKYDPEIEATMVGELGTFFTVASELERKIIQTGLPMDPTEAAAFEGDIVVLSSDARDFKGRVQTALRGGVEASQLRTALWGVALGAAAIGAGWYVFRSSRKKGRRR